VIVGDLERRIGRDQALVAELPVAGQIALDDLPAVDAAAGLVVLDDRIAVEAAVLLGPRDRDALFAIVRLEEVVDALAAAFLGPPLVDLGLDPELDRLGIGRRVVLAGADVAI